MDAEIKEAWVAALRSGRYKQGQGGLRATKQSGDVFCCLGVLCDVRWPSMWERSGGWRHFGYAGGVWPDLRIEAGLDLKDQQQLIEMNDQENATFSEIADWIERNM